MVKRQIDFTINIIRNIDIDIVVDKWNEYSKTRPIYRNDETTLDEVFAGFEHPVSEAIRAAIYSDYYNFSDYYFAFNALGNLISVDYNTDVFDLMDMRSFARWCLANKWYELSEVWYDDYMSEFHAWLIEEHHEDISEDSLWAIFSIDEIVFDDWDNLLKQIVGLEQAENMNNRCEYFENAIKRLVDGTYYGMPKEDIIKSLENLVLYYKNKE